MGKPARAIQPMSAYKNRSNMFALFYFVGFSIKITQNLFSRIGDHSTMASDDKAMHRSSKEVDYWQKELNPIVRLR